jgi:hypothetical protein
MQRNRQHGRPKLVHNAHNGAMWMRRFVTSFLGVLVLGGLLAGCGPSKPCQCAQQSGCHCPLPPRPAKEAKPLIPPAPAGNESHVVQRTRTRLAHRAHAARYPHSHRHYAVLMVHVRRSHHEAMWEQDGRNQRVRAHSTNALPYDYRSTSRRYRAGDRFAENYGGYEDAAPDYGHYGRRKPHHYSRAGTRAWGYAAGHGEAASGYAEDGYNEGPNTEGPEDYYSGNTGTAMSINSPAALDPWHGYDADCPDVYANE